MGKSENLETMYEYCFKFRHAGSDFINERHFNAANLNIARETFEFVCKKDEIIAEIDTIVVWNRWADRWEPAEKLVEEEADLIS